MDSSTGERGPAPRSTLYDDVRNALLLHLRAACPARARSRHARDTLRHDFTTGHRDSNIARIW